MNHYNYYRVLKLSETIFVVTFQDSVFTKPIKNRLTAERIANIMNASSEIYQHLEASYRDEMDKLVKQYV